MTASLRLPLVAYTGQTLGLFPDDQTPGLIYSVVVAPPGEAWENGVYTRSGDRLLALNSTGYYAIGLQGLNSSGAVVDNVFVGQLAVIEADRALDLVSRYDGRIDITTCASDISRQASSQAWRADIDSFGEFTAYVEAHQQAEGQIAGFSVQASQALFYMQWVSGLWLYGNLARPDLPGSVADNEVTGPVAPEDMTIRAYLDSPIGACTDYTVLMTLLLTSAGIENRVVSGAGHVFNEALIDGAWWTLDANLNLAYQAPFDDVINRGLEVDVFRFDHEGMRLGSTIYREALVEFYQTMMAELEFGQFEFGFRYDSVYFIETLPYASTILPAYDSIEWRGLNGDYSGYAVAPDGWTIGDFNGDGISDLLRRPLGDTGAEILLGTGTGFARPSTWLGPASSGEANWSVGDFDGDGRDDIFAYRPREDATSGAYVYLSNGGAFGAPSSWTPETNGDWGWSVGDFDGDGKDDILRLMNGVSGAMVHLSTGSSFAAGVSWTGYGSGSQNWYVGDFNGDGKDDLVSYIVAGNQTTVFLSNGSSFDYSGIWSTEGQGSGERWFVGDFDGDGRSDLGRAVDGVGFEWLRSVESGFEAPRLLTSDISPNMPNLYIGDFTGEGGSDLLAAINRYNGGLGNWLTEGRDPNGLTDREINEVITFAPARLVLAEVDSPVALEAADPGWRTATPDTFEALLAYVESRRSAQSGAEYMTPFTTDVAKVLFYAQWFGGMWEPGDAGAEAASLLAASLQHLGISNSVVTAGDGYVVNEFFADGEWWSVNAELGVAFRGRWDQVVDVANQPEGYIFDMASMQAGSPTFAVDASQVQRDFIIETGAGLLFDFDRSSGADWLAGTPSPGSTGPSSWGYASEPGYGWIIGDFNDDGRDDLLGRWAGTDTRISLSNGAGFAAGASWSPAGAGSEGWYVGDFNGDGKDDLFALVPGVSGARMLLSTGSEFVGGGSWTPAGSGSQRWYVADFNGDGKDDILRYVNGVSGAQVFLSTGAGFNPVGSWTPAGQGSLSQWFVGDYNGDGRGDLGRYLAGVGFQTLLSTGSGFAAPVTWNSELTSASGLRVADINGDGRDDLVILAPSMVSKAFLSSGNSFAAADWTFNPVTTANWLVGDFDGNGADDVFNFGPGVSIPGMNLSVLPATADIRVGTDGARDIFDVSQVSGNDTIENFGLSGGALADQLRVSITLAADMQTFLSMGHQVGLDTVFTFNSGQTLTVRETLLESFKAAHFVFV
jgi:hypothetical protein